MTLSWALQNADGRETMAKESAGLEGARGEARREGEAGHSLLEMGGVVGELGELQVWYKQEYLYSSSYWTWRVGNGEVSLRPRRGAMRVPGRRCNRRRLHVDNRRPRGTFCFLMCSYGA